MPLSPPPSPPAHKALDSKSQAHSQPLSLDSWRGILKRHYNSEAHRLEAPSSGQRVGGSSDTNSAASFPSLLADTAARLSAFPAIPEPLDADAEQRRALLDTGQPPFSDNSCTKRVHPQHSALGAADNPETGDLERALDDSGAYYSGSSRSNSGKPERGTDASTSSSERSASDSADNPSAVASTAHHFTDERTDERSARGDGDAGRWFGSEAAAMVPSSQLGGEPSACGA